MRSPLTSVALFGGTFDPFHNGHLRMAIEAKEALGISRVIFFPAHYPPHKPRQPVSEARHRFAMVAAGTAGLADIEVSDVEIKREGPSYSLLTVVHFRETLPDARIIFVMGADSFAEVSTWHRYRDLLSACDFLLLPRAGAGPEPAPPEGIRIEKEDPHCYSWQGRSYRLPGGRRLFCPSLPALDVSSSAIREKVRKGMCIRGLVQPEVERYILDNRLYVDRAEGRRP
ncbi:MAG TPA: nicotinate-nucleotide adenylyltransferase [Candidatus Deferrimicrobiaceae bacterium]